jgi:hypothetical protein
MSCFDNGQMTTIRRTKQTYQGKDDFKIISKGGKKIAEYRVHFLNNSEIILDELKS